MPEEVLGGMWESIKTEWESARPQVTGHCTLIEDFQASPTHFYGLVEKAIERRKIPGLRMSHVLHREGWIMSAAREYLRAERGKISFEICGAPFGTGFFVSCRMIVMPEKNGIFARIWKFLFNPNTFYQMDVAAMYQSAIESAVKEAKNELTQTKLSVPGLRTSAVPVLA
ncbi:MAG: hypothetical protein PHS53_00275 [Candidatus Pacebacteria bacterium]|nr:hypothetical protein [Candidatus Paceibacterota bacterium]